jgi:predicted Zn-ribbon and HTH transcriptional regulator
MKKIILTLFSVAMLFSLTQCNNPTSEKLCSNADTRGKIISELMNNDSYMNEVMDSMRTKHPDVILSTLFVIAKSDKAMQTEMMNNMMSMCSSDSSMCKMMIGKTMDMCDADQSKCSMMMGSMQSRPNVMKAMQSMRH